MKKYEPPRDYSTGATDEELEQYDTWTTGTGTKIKYSDMTTKHLKYAIGYANGTAKTEMRKELNSRGVRR